MFRYCPKGLKTKAVAVFPGGGSKKRKSTNDDEHGHGQEKRRHSKQIMFQYSITSYLLRRLATIFDH